MDMITVLNTIPAYPWLHHGMGIGAIIVLILGIVLGVIVQEESLTTLIIMIACFLGIGWAASSDLIQEQYECTINKNVVFADFVKTFEVDEQRGEIYVVHLKEKE